ncbi:MAG: hypothetical protein ACX93O_00010 [Flagellimonas sp.]
MSEPTTDPTLFNVEFLRTFISVIAGAIISLFSVLLVEWVKRYREKQEKKRILYNKLISTVNSIRRYEINCLEHGMAFNYHKTSYRLDSEDTLTRAQGEYHQQKRDELMAQIFEKVEALDSYSLEFKILCGNDDDFHKIIREINQWPRPDLSRFKDVSTLEKLNARYESEMEEKRMFTSQYWYKTVEDLDSYISKKLL